jgi:hypothetical protein
MNEINRVINHFVDLGFHLGRIEKSGGRAISLRRHKHGAGKRKNRHSENAEVSLHR